MNQPINELLTIEYGIKAAPNAAHTDMQYPHVRRVNSQLYLVSVNDLAMKALIGSKGAAVSHNSIRASTHTANITQIARTFTISLAGYTCMTELCTPTTLCILWLTY